ncbi:hypothetical protein ABVB69_13305 [Streptomyces sp. NPDC000349]|uniref:hypothetical protein n=1 Tax=unclassified Streptomyces TaxID=2593676 RepID=UPI00278B9D80|nr:hypothetical protein [Streptomyces sp. DSM 40167]MDQ0405312.1 hypothetical protein [Streptomyces sp. DSM 40167]
MEALSPQGALLVSCIARLPERSLPRHAWAAEVLVEQLWAGSPGGHAEALCEVLAPMIGRGGVDARRVRAEIWELARSGALVPVGAGNAARYEAADFAEAMADRDLSPQEGQVVDFAVRQLTARLLALSKTARAAL